MKTEKSVSPIDILTFSWIVIQLLWLVRIYCEESIKLFKKRISFVWLFSRFVSLRIPIVNTIDFVKSEDLKRGETVEWHSLPTCSSTKFWFLPKRDWTKSRRIISILSFKSCCQNLVDWQWDCLRGLVTFHDCWKWNHHIQLNPWDYCKETDPSVRTETCRITPLQQRVSPRLLIGFLGMRQSFRGPRRSCWGETCLVMFCVDMCDCIFIWKAMMRTSCDHSRWFGTKMIVRRLLCVRYGILVIGFVHFPHSWNLLGILSENEKNLSLSISCWKCTRICKRLTWFPSWAMLGRSANPDRS
jgi:hypothetical protein